VFALSLTVALLSGQVVDPTWLGGNGNWSNSSQWNTGSLPGNSSRAVIGANGASVVALDVNATVSQVQVGLASSLAIANNLSLTLSGTTGSITNDGTLSLNASANQTQIILSGGGAFTFSGSGVLSLSNSANNRIYGSANTETLTNASGHTIQGSGSIGLGLLGLSNAGLIRANQATPLLLDPNAPASPTAARCAPPTTPRSRCRTAPTPTPAARSRRRMLRACTSRVRPSAAARFPPSAPAGS